MCSQNPKDSDSHMPTHMVTPECQRSHRRLLRGDNAPAQTAPFSYIRTMRHDCLSFMGGLHAGLYMTGARNAGQCGFFCILVHSVRSGRPIDIQAMFDARPFGRRGASRGAPPAPSPCTIRVLYDCTPLKTRGTTGTRRPFLRVAQPKTYIMDRRRGLC